MSGRVQSLSRDINNPSQTSFLFQRLSLAIVSGNAFLIMTSAISPCPDSVSQIVTANLSSVVLICFICKIIFTC